MEFKLGYSTYALKMVDPFRAIRLVKDTGYEALEVCLSEDSPTSPLHFSSPKQVELRNLCEDLGFPSPILFADIDVCAYRSDRVAMFELTKQKFEMAHRLHFDDSPIMVTTTHGRSAPPWESGKYRIRDALLELADMAADNDVVVAIEAHAGTDFETPEKAVWMMEQTKHSNLRLDLDISHFVVEGSEMVRSVNLCAPYAAMVHIKDGEKKNGKVQYCLPGDGGIDVTGFLDVLRANGLEDMPVFAEVSVQQSSRIDYDPKGVAEFCFIALDTARETSNLAYGINIPALIEESPPNVK